MPIFNPSTSPMLNTNTIYTGLLNMIANQYVAGNNIKNTYSRLVDAARRDGGMLGDKHLRYSTSSLDCERWIQDSPEALNLLAVKRVTDTKCQAIVIDQCRQIWVTTDAFMTKQAWMDEGTFAAFNGVILSMIEDSKRVYESKLYNVFVGTTEATAETGTQKETVTIGTDDNFGLKLGESIANTLIKLEDPTEDHNDFGQLRSYNAGDFKIVMPASIWNRCRKVDLPVVFHNEGILDQLEIVVLPDYHFGTPRGTTGTANTGEGNTTNQDPIRSRDDMFYDVASAEADLRAKAYTKANGQTAYRVHVKPGDILPDNVTYNLKDAYAEDQTIAYKIIHKEDMIWMNGIVSSTTFNHPKNHSTNNYLTFVHNTLEHFYDLPLVTCRIVEVDDI